MGGRKSSVFLIISMFVVLICGRAEAAGADPIPRAAGDIYVQDRANVLNPNEEAQLIQLGRTVEDHTSNQIAVLTVNSIGDEAIEDYANRAYREYGLGTEKEDNGVLLLLAMKEKKIRIEVGYGLEGVIPDGRAGRIIDENAIPSLQADQSNIAVMKTYGAIANAVSGDGSERSETPQQEDGGSIPTWLVILLVVGLIILDFVFFGGTLTFFLLSIFSRGGGGGGPRSGGGGSSGGGGASRGW
ncbi:TPM domain-containing protein [Peribacillus deserti]|uniref:TPM domain-containing protein n=1 Tax=Peribacillus deserti TaxID=673318 RepID=A0A2N5M884_9BACI|nr:TPM domain-containing protein [Peribacillus deserti]PLT30513.1 hypothetical protein CUU66_07590 [Peribacillus deserti]